MIHHGDCLDVMPTLGADVPPPDPPCEACRHPMSAHDDDGCDGCAAWGGSCA